MNITAGCEQRPIPQPQFKLAYSRAEAAAQLGVSTRCLDYAIATGELNVRRIGSRVIVPHAELEKFLKRDHPGRVQ